MKRKRKPTSCKGQKESSGEYHSNLNNEGLQNVSAENMLIATYYNISPIKQYGRINKVST